LGHKFDGSIIGQLTVQQASTKSIQSAALKDVPGDIFKAERIKHARRLIGQRSSGTLALTNRFGMITVLVPAAGLSSRMGQNKLLMRFGEKSLIEHAVDTLMASDIDEIIVVLGHQADRVRGRLQGKRVIFVDNPDYRQGLSTSIRAGLGAVPKAADAIMIYLADQPLLESEEISQLIRAFRDAKRAGKSIVVPFFGGRRGNPVILAASYREKALNIVGDVGCRQIISSHPDQVFAVPMEKDHVVRDVDTPEDFGRMG
jgi:molybdenum cofactor cytidylyltransferase